MSYSLTHSPLVIGFAMFVHWVEHVSSQLAVRLIADDSEMPVTTDKGASLFLFNVLPFPRKPTLDIEQLYTKHAGMVARRVSRFVSRDEVEEVVHEVFLRAFERKSSYRGDASPVTWLYHIATNHCLNRLRDQKRRRQALHVNRDLPWLLPSDAVDSRVRVLLEQVWSLLSEEQATIAIYYFIDGMSHADIARVMAVSRRTIGNRLEELTTLVRSHAEDEP